ncbi:unnamed protein product [Calypogeia fissa]
MSSDDVEGTPQDLIPGIPNDVTWSKIVPKLSWRALQILPSVSRAWCDAIRSRQVYNVRARDPSTEMLVLVNYAFSTDSTFFCNGIAVYSMRDNTFIALPPIPDGSLGFSEGCQSVSLGGKIYVLGGQFRGSCNVYALDLNVPKQWRRCANMIDPRAGFGCSVMDGKIYAFGGSRCNEILVLESEVYDSKTDTWSSISPRPTRLRFCDRVENMGDEFLLLHRFDPAVDDDPAISTFGPKTFDVYNPATDEWRFLMLKRIPAGLKPLFFMAQGRLHWMSRTNPFNINVHNADDNSWTLLQSSSFVSFGPVDSILVKPLTVLAVNDQLLAVVHWSSRHDTQTNGFCLARSKGLGSETTEIEWRKVGDLTHRDKKFTGFSMHSFEL